MTITVQYKTDRTRWDQSVLFETDVDDQGAITFDYSSELGGDTVSTAVSTTDGVTAGTHSISSNVVTVALSGFNEGLAKLELKMTSTAGNVLSNNVRFRVKDHYNG